MNLKLGKNSIRLRVELAEAQSLCQSGVLTERLPFGTENLTVSIRADHRDDICGLPFQENRLEFSVPHLALKKLLADAEGMTKTSDLEIKSEAFIAGNRVEIRFEIDHFSKPRRNNK